MHRGAWSRVAGALLALLLLASTGGASDLDALLFHTGGAPAVPTERHYERPGAGHHADHCLLALRISSGRRPRPRAVAIRLQAPVQQLESPRPPAAPHRFYPGLHQDLRAPPTSRV
jgi:hypothetical protein